MLNPRTSRSNPLFAFAGWKSCEPKRMDEDSSTNNRLLEPVVETWITFCFVL